MGGAREQPPAARSPLGAFWAYLGERFPLPVLLLLSLAVGGAATAVAQAPLIAARAPLVLDATALGSWLLVLLFLFHLRVFDEHKDFAIDSRTRPDRPVQRGLITLGQLKVAGAVALAAELVLAALPGTVPAAYYALPLGFSVLMLFEFFAKEWLSARMILYAVTHSVVMPMLTLALIVRYTAPGGLPLADAAYGLFGLSFASAFALDVLRKTWAPDSEIEGLDSYSKRYGPRAAAALGALLLSLAGGLAAWVGWQLGGRAVWLAVVGALTAGGYLALIAFARGPTAARAKHLELVGGLHHIAVFLGLLVVAAWQNGVIFSLADHVISFGVRVGGT